MDSFLAENIPINIEDEMKNSYMDYAMSVIISRALPDVRDGLKPVHRRVLYAMNEMGNVWNKAYKKSARIVGDVIGKYHPHGDAASYETIVRMAQNFSMRYILIDGQGNFGSVDGDPPAAMRYTEIRMTQFASELLTDIEKETVDFMPNYDGSLEEPAVLPSQVPLLLINGSSGIAVGMASNIPPHNLGEIIDGIIALIENQDIGVEELIKYISGPDFPTGGFINGRDGIRSAYETGKGIVHIRAKTHIEEGKKGEKEKIVITELPYQVNKARLIEKIDELVRDKKIDGIAAVRDESDREGMRIVIELKKDEMMEVVLNQLFQHTQMQTSFGINMLAIVNNQPKVLNLKSTLSYFIAHRQTIVKRRTLFELKKAEERLHIIKGYIIALLYIDEVINIIKASNTPKDARNSLQEKYDLSEIQAQAILELRLQKLTSLEREKVDEECKSLEASIYEYGKILESEERVLNIIKDELKGLKEKYNDKRRTEIVDKHQDISIEDLIADEEMVVSVTTTGYIKRTSLSIYRSQKRGGKGVSGMSTKKDDFVENLFIAGTHNYILFFSDMGKVYWLKVYEVPEGGRLSKGKAMINLLNISQDEKVTAMLPIKEFSSDLNIIMTTKNGIIKKTSLMAFSRPRSSGIIAISLDKGDRLISANLSNNNQDVFICTSSGKAIRFDEKQIREIGRAGRGVKGIKLSNDDHVVGVDILEENSF
ncbi:MAG: DNA gyrase subunit A, partial [Thermodesulfobacteriota bacterium]|nr:DNA gyrase subunit A [Thermodesulfobacteriota bacterium]